MNITASILVVMLTVMIVLNTKNMLAGGVMSAAILLFCFVMRLHPIYGLMAVFLIVPNNLGNYVRKLHGRFTSKRSGPEGSGGEVSGGEGVVPLVGGCRSVMTPSEFDSAPGVHACLGDDIFAIESDDEDDNWYLHTFVFVGGKYRLLRSHTHNDVN